MFHYLLQINRFSADYQIPFALETTAQKFIWQKIAKWRCEKNIFRFPAEKTSSGF